MQVVMCLMHFLIFVTSFVIEMKYLVKGTDDINDSFISIYHKAFIRYVIIKVSFNRKRNA